MTVVDGGYFCKYCSKTVYDFTGTKADEFRKILMETPYICGKYRSDQIASAPLKLPVWRKWISGAMLFLGFEIFTVKSVAQEHKKITHLDSLSSSSRKDSISNKETVFGGIDAISAEFPGGPDSLNSYIYKHLNYRGKAKGRVVVQFTVEPNGALTNIQVLRGIGDTEASKEAVRVFKTSPKWKPAIQNGQPIKQQYTVPVSFNL
ncbi:energy transducer TonB [Mucilaginibacter sp. KACC 22063]|uniref:energy transducer TonB n=1 Tax=Mucilaginibacter sp. KACC 22063 TaxID=3025666 RepID=UPI0023660776|nr:energy transducer TonB [Mucilaginibacter sp. KACC 22063]WDF56495.1 energy transducer TonB [Mucilaginibacter sp. KACC 22063]